MYNLKQKRLKHFNFHFFPFFSLCLIYSHINPLVVVILLKGEETKGKEKLWVLL